MGRSRRAHSTNSQQDDVLRLVGEVIKLDRDFPLVRTVERGDVRTEHATALVKGTQHGHHAHHVRHADHAPRIPHVSQANLAPHASRAPHTHPTHQRAVIGDRVLLELPEGHDKAIIVEILPRRTELVRKDPTERALPQVLAANFDLVIIAQPLADLNMKRLERELVLAHETRARVAVVLTKADLADSREAADQTAEAVRAFVGADDAVLVISAEEPESIEAVRALIPAGTTAVLIGKSGVGKSSLVNMLVGSEVRQTAQVREGDGKGRHTTVSRDIIELAGGGRVIDMPGVRGLALWDAQVGIELAFSDVEELVASCRFRDCRHESEPGCAVRAAVEAGSLSQSRFDSYQELRRETREMEKRREEAARIRERTGHPRHKDPRHRT